MHIASVCQQSHSSTITHRPFCVSHLPCRSTHIMTSYHRDTQNTLESHHFYAWQGFSICPRNYSTVLSVRLHFYKSFQISNIVTLAIRHLTYFFYNFTLDLPAFPIQSVSLCKVFLLMCSQQLCLFSPYSSNICSFQLGCLLFHISNTVPLNSHK